MKKYRRRVMVPENFRFAVTHLSHARSGLKIRCVCMGEEGNCEIDSRSVDWFLIYLGRPQQEVAAGRAAYTGSVATFEAAC